MAPEEPRKLHLMGNKQQVEAALRMVNELLRTAPILQVCVCVGVCLCICVCLWCDVKGEQQCGHIQIGFADRHHNPNT